MVIQEGPKICKDLDLLSSKPISEENGSTKLGISAEVLKKIINKSIDDVGCLLLNEETLQ
jgi:hypothetical protein